MIYDVNGFIAGMQSLVSKTADTSHYDFKMADWYDEDEIEGRKTVVEAMFLNPFSFLNFPHLHKLYADLKKLSYI